MKTLSILIPSLNEPYLQKTLEDLETWVTVSDFKITYPEYHLPIKYPFAV